MLTETESQLSSIYPELPNSVGANQRGKKEITLAEDFASGEKTLSGRSEMALDGAALETRLGGRGGLQAERTDRERESGRKRYEQ